MQNIYDDPIFFTGYEELRRTESGLNAALEQPALRRLLPASLAGAAVLDLGCGFGDFARHARSLGARRVVGIDVSARMLERARRLTDDEGIAYLQAPIEAFEWTGEPFDLVVSSLALHYVRDYAGALVRIAASMKDGALFAFSVEHPMSTAREEQDWHRSADGKELFWPVDRYLEEGPRNTTWFVENVVKYHRTVATYVNGLLDAGLRVARLDEPGPTDEALAARPELALHFRRPPFLLLSAVRQR